MGKEEIKFEDLSKEEQEKITATIKESLRQEIYQELEDSYTYTSEKNPEVKGQFESSIAEENNNTSLPNKIKKSPRSPGRFFSEIDFLLHFEIYDPAERQRNPFPFFDLNPNARWLQPPAAECFSFLQLPNDGMFHAGPVADV